jgi:competence ComEA-like helix-hairpin-helix protein
VRKVIVDLTIVFALFAVVSANAAPWKTLDDCHYVANAANDGDSFHVTSKGKQYLFRLYFVDTAETDTSLGERIDEQAKYFHITPKQTVEVGKVAAQYTRDKLTQPFTVRTCFQDALGRSKMQRFYAIVQTTSGDLGEQLIENGLARIHGASANPTGLPRANVEWQKLQQLEREAKLEKVGAWGVNVGRMLAKSQKATNRAAVDPFDAFFHPERAAQNSYAPPKKSDFDAFFHHDAEKTEFGFRKRSPAPSPQREPSATPAPLPQPNDPRSTPFVIDSSKLDVNTATAKELDAVPGIGSTLVQRIIAARPFKSADDLRHVKGIGDTRYEKIRPYFQ